MQPVESGRLPDLPDIAQFARVYERFMIAMAAHMGAGDSAIGDRLRNHLGADPADLPTTRAEFPDTDHPNLQLGLDAVLAGAERIGYYAVDVGFGSVSLADLARGRSAGGPITEGPVRFTDVEVESGRVVRCVSAGIYLAAGPGGPAVVLIAHAERPFGPRAISIEIASPADEVPSAVLRDVRAAMRERNIYRGRCISLHLAPNESVTVAFHAPEPVGREHIVLPAGTLERLERQSLGMAGQAPGLRRAGQDLKRGVLLHGPPGTGKTLCVSYLLGAMPGRTAVLLTGRSLGLIEQAVRIARDLEPATVVLEDVDLVAAERTMDFGDHGVLFELLNQMEGLEGDADLLFVLTTNRPDVIEPALASRPGRIDLALEIPLPDEATRRRLVKLYAGGFDLPDAAVAEVAARTDGVSGAFVKELMRQAMLRAALDGRERAGSEDVGGALDELLDERSALTRRLLGQPAGPGGSLPDAPPSDHMLRAFEATGIPLPPDLET